MKRLPSISICIATFNSGNVVERTLKDIRKQAYPQEKIEILFGDGGSTDNTKELAEKYNVRFIEIPEEKQHAE